MMRSKGVGVSQQLYFKLTLGDNNNNKSNSSKRATDNERPKLYLLRHPRTNVEHRR